MLRTLLIAGAATLAVPALAQVSTEVDDTVQTPATQAEMDQPAQAQPAPVMGQAVPRDPLLTGMGGPLNIESNWDRFDNGSKGYLTPLEFAKWVMETNGQDVKAEVNATLRSRQPGIPAVQVLNTASVALTQVDTNSDWRVTRDELAAIAE